LFFKVLTCRGVRNIGIHQCFGHFVQVRQSVSTHIFQIDITFDIVVAFLLSLELYQESHLLIEKHDFERLLSLVLSQALRCVELLIDDRQSLNDLFGALQILYVLHGALYLLL